MTSLCDTGGGGANAASGTALSSLRDRARKAVSTLRASIGFRSNQKPASYVHIYAPQPSAKSLTPCKCPDCKQDTVFVGFHTEWHGWDETCIRCGRGFADGEWLELEFSRFARRDRIEAALTRWHRQSDAELIKRVKVSP